MSDNSASSAASQPSSGPSSSSTTTAAAATTSTSTGPSTSSPIDTGTPSGSDSASASNTDSASASSSAPSTTSSAPPATTSSAPPPSLSPTTSLQVSTDPGGNVVTQTLVHSITPAAPSASESAAVREASKGFLQNKAAVGATFAIVGLVVAGILFALVTNTIRRRRAKRFDREIAEEAKRAPPAPAFMDDDDYGGYSAYGAANPDPYGHGPVSDGYPPPSEAVHSSTVGGTGTPSNYMYASGYSDLGFSDVSSHGTYTQPPMSHEVPGAGGYGGYAGYGAAGAYEMTGYGHGQQQQQEWQGQQGYVYPGEEAAAGGAAAGGYPPTAAATTDQAQPALARSKSGTRSLVDSYNSPPPEVPSHAQMPHYADGYVAQYQTHVEDAAAAYGGVESQHGHVGGLDDEEEEEQHAGPRVLKVANE